MKVLNSHAGPWLDPRKLRLKSEQYKSDVDFIFLIYICISNIFRISMEVLKTWTKVNKTLFEAKHFAQTTQKFNKIYWINIKEIVRRDNHTPQKRKYIKKEKVKIEDDIRSKKKHIGESMRENEENNMWRR